jgi:hypothetical protein
MFILETHRVSWVSSRFVQRLQKKSLHKGGQMAKKQKGADIRVLGTKAQIERLLTAFTAKGFTWQSNQYFYPRIGQPDFFSYYLENLESVAQDNSSLKE